MDQKYHIELLDRFLQGLTTEEEEKILKDWIRQPEARENFNAYYRQCWHLASDSMDRATQDEIFADILKEIDETPLISKENTDKKKPRRYLSVVKYAATACIIAVVALGAYFMGTQQTDTDSGLISMAVMNGQKADITLADGTRVYINSDSKVTYDNTYNKKNRTLVLEGEAYFEVAKNKDKPFIVKVNGIDVEALGTSFNVRAHTVDKLVSVTLIEGKVKVTSSEQEDILNPNERIEYDLISKTFEKSEIHPNADHLLWRSNQLAFYGESLEEVCKTLTRMYNCNFVFKSEAVKKYTYSGIIRNNSLTNVLDFISQTASIKYEIKPDNTIVIYKK